MRSKPKTKLDTLAFLWGIQGYQYCGCRSYTNLFRLPAFCGADFSDPSRYASPQPSERHSVQIFCENSLKMSVSTTSIFSSHPPETNSDIVTSWLPITSAWPAVPECQTGGIYSQIGDNGALQIAYDPFFGISVEPSLTCLPPFATLWWSESTTVPLFTKTSLGPLVCPEAYSTAYSSTLNAQSTFVACCPSLASYFPRNLRPSN